MTIDELRELGGYIHMKEHCHDDPDDFLVFRLTKEGQMMLELINAEIYRQSVTDEEVLE